MEASYVENDSLINSLTFTYTVSTVTKDMTSSFLLWAPAGFLSPANAPCWVCNKFTTTLPSYQGGCWVCAFWVPPLYLKGVLVMIQAALNLTEKGLPFNTNETDKTAHRNSLLPIYYFHEWCFFLKQSILQTFCLPHRLISWWLASGGASWIPPHSLPPALNQLPHTHMARRYYYHTRTHKHKVIPITLPS